MVVYGPHSVLTLLTILGNYDIGLVQITSGLSIYESHDDNTDIHTKPYSG